MRLASRGISLAFALSLFGGCGDCDPPLYAGKGGGDFADPHPAYLCC